MKTVTLEDSSTQPSISPRFSTAYNEYDNCYEILDADKGNVFNAFELSDAVRFLNRYCPPLLKEGEIYAGIIFGKDGASDHHLVLLPGEQEDINWKDALTWAKEQGGELPNRREQALLYANLKEGFKEAWYWSNTQHASYSGYAWCQYFGHGRQDYTLKGNGLRARAVRRLSVIQ